MSADWELHIGSRGYPAHLRDGQRPPKVLFGMGDPTTLVPGLAIIGARQATPYGLACARMFAAAAADAGVTVISGAAVGCDLAAQSAALEAGGRSVAVLGCGADYDYPRRAAPMLGQLRSGRGCVVSELAWTTPPRPGQFPARNRIIAGLAAAVLVVEAALPSGTFSTADSALDSGRDVLAVPGSILYAGSSGSNRLIRQGAAPITCIEDLQDAMASAGLIPTRGSAVERDSVSDGTTDPLALAIRAHPMYPDAAADALGMRLEHVLAALARLEAAGVVARHADGRYGPC
jgi:DNA processing protein